MSKLLLDWLNDEVKLSHTIVSIENDFCNGYLLGELLHRYNQQSDFEKFIDKSTPDAKIINFCSLEPTMRRIGIRFSSKVVFDIVNAKKGVMKTMLYEIKTALDGISKNSSNFKSSKSDSKVLRIIQPSRPSYDKTQSDTFETAIRSFMENPNTIRMMRATEKYTSRINDFRQSIITSYTMEMNSLEQEIQRKKIVANQRKKHDKEFMDAWETINVRKWADNQQIAKQRRALVNKVKMISDNKRESRLTWERNTAREKTLQNIDDFDERLRTEVFRDEDDLENFTKHAIKTVAAQPSKGIPKLLYLDQNFLKTGLVNKQKAIKEHHEDLLVKQQEHGRRQRRFIRGRESYQTDILQASAESDIMNQLLNESASEELEHHIRDRLLRNKDLIVENRQNRDELIARQHDVDRMLVTERRREEAMREYHWVVKPRIYTQRDRLEAYDLAHAASSRRTSIEVV